jgi:hypothetical protein
MWLGFLLYLPQIIRTRNLFPLDKFMSPLTAIKIKGKFGRFTINPSRIDSLISEESSAFSSVRELYVKDCYLRYHQIDCNEIKTLVDLGANRGMVSAMFTPVADKIVAIEAQEKYNQVIHEIITVQNKFANVSVGNYFVGSNEFTLQSEHKVSFAFIQQHYGLKSIDFLKMDIEGSEFDIIGELPYPIIKYISMEVHRDFGDPRTIAQVLSLNNFGYILADSSFVITQDYNKVDYIYAWNNSLVSRNK